MGIYAIVYYKREWISIFVKTNIGITIGYLFVVFAPGNLVRMQIEHDVARSQAGILEKLGSSLLSHVVVLGIRNPIVILLIVVALWWIGKNLISKQITIKNLLFDNLEYLVAGVASLFLWAVVAPPVGLYGLVFFKAILIIWFLRTVKIDLTVYKWNLLLPGIAIVSYLLVNIGWIEDFVNVSNLRKTQIQEAIDRGQEEVIVAKYPDTTNNCMTSYNFANIDGVYESEEHVVYYGIQIINHE